MIKILVFLIEKNMIDDRIISSEIHFIHQHPTSICQGEECRYTVKSEKIQEYNIIMAANKKSPSNIPHLFYLFYSSYFAQLLIYHLSGLKDQIYK